ncbi:MAG TPA: cytochrome ubiquinol oxidase subunit I [Candidatus Sulfomarinibacteraceae bacterium]|nr:cytochrome ubiquinol oxidase subunit I [Candidatus Sulfomarinibacteraceae bacterium]
MELVDLARLQFATTTLYHFIFVPLTIGLALVVAVMQTVYVRTGDEIYKQMTKFWGKLFLINFAMGVVTGIVQEFQFGMAWSEYSRFVGDIFGAPLAIEALMAFFIESTFIGLWIFGWDRLPKKVHLATIWLVAAGAILSSLWILIANGWMQNPVGYEIVDGRAQMVDFAALVTNPNVFLQFPHVIFAAFTTAGFFIIAISAYRLLRARTSDEQFMFERSMRIGLVFGLSAVMVTMVVGHFSGQFMVEKQPMKLAAAEGLWESESPASLSFFQIGDEASRTSLINIRIPSLLSFMVYDTFDGMVPGINDLNAFYQAQYADRYGPDADYVPPMIWMTYWSFRAMVGFGALMSVLAIVGIFLWWRGRLAQSRLFLAVLPFAIVLPYIANGTGWMLTELGRQPWIVQDLMRTEEGLSPNLAATDLWISLIGFTAVYGALAVADFYLLWKFGTRGQGTDELLPLPDAVQDDDSGLEGAY